MRLNPDRTGTWSATAVGLGEGLVQVEVHRVEAHQSGRGDAEDGVEVGAVVVHLTASLVNDFTGCLDVGFKQTQRVGVGDHHRRRGFVSDRSEGVEVHATVGQAWNFDDFETSHGGAGGVGAVRRIGDDDLGSLVFTTVSEVLLNASDGRELALGACHRLQGDLVHAGAHFEHVLHLVEDGQQPLEVVFWLVRVDICNAGELSDDSLTRGLCFMVQEPNG